MTQIIPFNIALKQRREHLGISWERASEMLCLSDMEYFDLELHEDEWRMAVPAFVVRSAIAFFEIDWRNAFDWPTAGTIEASLPLNDFLRSLRESNGLDRDTFSDRVGFHEQFAQTVEDEPDGLLLYPFFVSIDLAISFGINAVSLVECLLEPHRVAARIAAARRRA